MRLVADEVFKKENNFGNSMYPVHYLDVKRYIHWKIESTNKYLKFFRYKLDREDFH